MGKTIAYQLCEEFADKVKAIVQEKTKQDVKQYQSIMVQNLVVDENKETYEEILTYIKKIENLIDYIMEA